MAPLPVRLLLPILLGAFALSLPAAAAGAAPPPQFFGVEAKDVFYSPPANQTAELDRQRQAGVGLNRHVFDWAGIERSAGQYTWTGYDNFMANAARRGIEVMPLLFNPPSYRSGRPPGDTRAGTYPPRDFADLGRFGAVVATRYGPRGSFWAAHPELPRVPIRSYQLWNEPHLPAFWPARPNPAEYARLLKEAAPQLKAADPGARIVTAGISQSTLPGAISLRNFINGMYAAGAAPAFDTVALHPYSETPAGAVGLVEQARSIMNSNGDSSTSLWVTEIGWASQGPAHRFTTSEAGQAANLRTLLVELSRRRAELGVQGVIWHGWRDLPPPPDWWGRYTGLIRTDGTEKPALAAYRDVANAGSVPPVAAFSFAPAAPQSGQDVTFDSSSSDPDGSLVAQRWDLDGDGQFDDASGARVTHRFTRPGTFSVSLEVEDDKGAKQRVSRSVVVGAPAPDPDPDPGGGDPEPRPHPQPRPATGAKEPPALVTTASLRVRPRARLRSLLRGLVGARVRCSSACTVEVVAKVSGRTARRLHLRRRQALARSRRDLHDARATAVTVRVPGRLRRALKAMGPFRMTLTVRIRDRDGRRLSGLRKVVSVR